MKWSKRMKKSTKLQIKDRFKELLEISNNIWKIYQEYSSFQQNNNFKKGKKIFKTNQKMQNHFWKEGQGNTYRVLKVELQ